MNVSSHSAGHYSKEFNYPYLFNYLLKCKLYGYLLYHEFKTSMKNNSSKIDSFEAKMRIFNNGSFDFILFILSVHRLKKKLYLFVQ